MDPDFVSKQPMRMAFWERCKTGCSKVRSLIADNVLKRILQKILYVSPETGETDQTDGHHQLRYNRNKLLIRLVRCERLPHFHICPYLSDTKQLKLSLCTRSRFFKKETESLLNSKTDGQTKTHVHYLFTCTTGNIRPEFGVIYMWDMKCNVFYYIYHLPN